MIVLSSSIHVDHVGHIVYGASLPFYSPRRAGVQGLDGKTPSCYSVAIVLEQCCAEGLRLRLASYTVLVVVVFLGRRS
jgi:hypothetical protein